MRVHNTRSRLLACVSAAALTMLAVPASRSLGAEPSAENTPTATPIKHVIIIVGENRSFDHVFGTFVPNTGQTVWNLLSQGIVKADGTPGPHYSQSAQLKAVDTTKYQINPGGKTPYSTLPSPTTGGAPESPSDSGPPFNTLAEAQAVDHDVPKADLFELTTGATGLPTHSPDTRIHYDGQPVTNLPDGSYQITGPSMTYDDYAGSPVHRFYQMWQQTDCAKSHVTAAHPNPCLSDLFAWVEATIAAGSNGAPPPGNYNSGSYIGEGAIALGFYNVQQGDMPYFNQLAHRYTLADNYHQPTMGGTGADSVVLGFADYPYYSDGLGHATAPPAGEIENPNPLTVDGTHYNNWYIQDGYGAAPFSNNPDPKGGTYSECTNPSNPGVAPILTYLDQMGVASNCQSGHYYLLNNYDPGYFGNGEVDTIDTYTIPPSSLSSIGDVLLAKNVSWAYYGEGWDQYVQNPLDSNNVYCNICNPFQYQTSIMTKPDARAHLKDTRNLYAAIKDGTLPSVAYVKPGGLNDGHPSSSKFDIFEGFAKKIVDMVQGHPDLWASTAIFITVDEGGGYYDSGYIQPLDFFGDGTRIPLLVVSPYSKGGYVVHDYSDHASIPKFIEANWKLPKISNRSRDNLPNPTTSGNPYIPTNGPAISDLMGMFHF